MTQPQEQCEWCGCWFKPSEQAPEDYCSAKCQFQAERVATQHERRASRRDHDHW